MSGTAFAASLFSLLLYAAPGPFRCEYGPQMRRDFADALRDERAVRGLFGAILFALGAYADILATGLREQAAMIFRDLVFAARSLRKTPLFALVVVATLALAIGANASVFSILRAVVLAPLPYAQPGRLVAVEDMVRGKPSEFALPDFADIKAQDAGLEQAAAFFKQSETMTGRGRPQRLAGIATTTELFATLGTQPELGRFFTATEGRRGAARTIVVSDALWRTALGGDPQIVGQTLVLDGISYRVIGVAPRGFAQPSPRVGFSEVSFWQPLPDDGAGTADYGSRNYHAFDAIARLRRGTSIASANAQLAAITSRIARHDPADDKNLAARTTMLDESLVGSVKPLLFAVFAAVAGVLLVACANVSNLLLSRAASRDRELAVRVALGASRRRIIAQLLVETFGLTLVGGVFGIAIAIGIVRGFIALGPRDIPRLDAVSVDSIAILYTLGVVALCTLLAGLVPAFASSRRDVTTALKAAGRSGDASSGARTRGGLVAAEIALTLALVVAAGLVVRSFVALTQQPLGFDPTGVYVVGPVDLPAKRYATPASQAHFMSAVVARATAVPGVADVAWTATPPFSGEDLGVAFQIASRAKPPAGDEPSSTFNLVGPQYFATVHDELREGRFFTDGDRLGAPDVVVVNKAFVQTFLKGQRVVGARIVPQLSVSNTVPLRTIVGVVADMRRSYAKPAVPMAYLPAAQFPWTGSFLVVRAAASSRVAAAVAASVPASDALMPLPKLFPLSASLAQNIAQTRLAVASLSALGLIALALSIAGIYAVVSYGVTQRTHELGIRMALGARASHVIRNVVRGALRLTALGVLAGIVLAGFTVRFVAAQLYGVTPFDPLTFATVIVIIAFAASSAALIPARRATRVDPIVALRYE